MALQLHHRGGQTRLIPALAVLAQVGRQRAMQRLFTAAAHADAGRVSVRAESDRRQQVAPRTRRGRAGEEGDRSAMRDPGRHRDRATQTAGIKRATFPRVRQGAHGRDRAAPQALHAVGDRHIGESPATWNARRRPGRRMADLRPAQVQDQGGAHDAGEAVSDERVVAAEIDDTAAAGDAAQADRGRRQCSAEVDGERPGAAGPEQSRWVAREVEDEPPVVTAGERKASAPDAKKPFPSPLLLSLHAVVCPFGSERSTADCATPAAPMESVVSNRRRPRMRKVVISGSPPPCGCHTCVPVLAGPPGHPGET